MKRWKKHNHDRDLHRPAEFGDDLRPVDEQMWRVARATDHPAGLTRRVFEASVVELPARRLRLADRQPAPRVSSASWWTNRFAVGLRLAAAIALVLIAGLYVLNTPTAPAPGTSPDGGLMATAGMRGSLDSVDDRATPSRPSSELDGDEWVRVLLASANHSADDAMYLINTQDATYSQVHTELTRLKQLIEEQGM